MAFRFQNVGPVGPEEFFWGWWHILLGAQRRIFARPSAHYLDRYIGKGYPIEPVLTSDKGHARCYICGYDMAQLNAAAGFRIEACSATNLKKMLDNGRFDQWASGLKKSPVEASVESSSLQTFGH
jgi:hypothetical protein